jgi:D-amino-acid dehydrogenase
LLGDSVKRVVIIGGGVIGLCAAYYATQRGHEVTVIDRAPDDHEGCSYGNAGMVVPSHFVPLAAPGMVALGLKWMWNPESPFYIKPRLDADLLKWGFQFWKAATAKHVERAAPLLRDLNFQSRAAFEELSKIFDFGLTQRGLLMLCKTEHTLHEEAATAEKARQLGVPAEVLNRDAASKIDPDVQMDIAGAIYFPKDCHLAPGRFMAGLKAKLIEMGAKFFWKTDVHGFASAGSQIKSVATSSGEFVADEFVIACGSWSSLLSKQLGLNLPMQAGKGYSLTLANPRELPRICAIFTEARVAVTPMGSSLRFGGTMEIAGLNESINRARVDGIIKSIPKYYPNFKPSDFTDVKPWSGLRPCSPDGLPYLGRAKHLDNLCITTGHAMMGLSLGPITGQLCAEIISNEKPRLDISLLDPNRFN